MWLGLAVIILVGTYISFPLLANKTISYVGQLESGGLSTVGDRHVQWFAIGTILLALSLIAFACYLLGRSALIEIELAAWFCGLADALCLCGDNVEQLEKVAAIVVPKPKHISTLPLSSKDIKPLVDLVRR
jgi:hypothetical protein